MFFFFPLKTQLLHNVSDSTTPEPFVIHTKCQFSLLWRIDTTTQMTADIDNGSLLVTFIAQAPSQKDIDDLKSKIAFTLEEHTKFTNTNLQPLQHVVRFELPPFVISENYTCVKSEKFIEFQFAIGRVKKMKIEIPE